jgi:hypothetical protein
MVVLTNLCNYLMKNIIDSDPVVRKKKFQQIWKEDILINYKNSKNFAFDKNYN